jgi:hypothetical protein
MSFTGLGSGEGFSLAYGERGPLFTMTLDPRPCPSRDIVVGGSGLGLMGKRDPQYP